ncbi:MAG: mannitol dehydrogenase family protein, partial [Cytophagaceae bacterium]
MTDHQDSKAGPKAIKLSTQGLASIASSGTKPHFDLPTYDRKALKEQIVHIAMRDVMKAQDCLYTVIERSAGGQKARVIGSITSYLHAPSNPEAVIAKMADENTQIVSLTITESGYYENEATAALDTDHPDIAYDLKSPEVPKTVYGYLARALDRRRQAGHKPFTLMSCDNIQQNGTLLRKMMLTFTREANPALGEWLSAHGAFPNSMVDRITPRTGDKDKEGLKKNFGLDDAWPVVTEPFLQWVIEDDFAGARPPWEKVGVQVVKNVEPYEMMKLRLLNASHSA